MHLSRVVVKNFRNLTEFELCLEPGLNVLVGENNVGKTSLLDSIRAALGSAAATGEPLRLRPDDLNWHSMQAEEDGTIRIDLTFAGLSEDERAEFLEVLDYNAQAPTNSTASIHFEWTWSKASQRWHSRRWGGSRPDAEGMVSEETLQSLPVTFLEALRNALSALVPGRNSRLGRLLLQSVEPSSRSAVEAIVRNANEQLENNPTIKTAERNIQDALAAASGPHFSQGVAIRTAEPQFERIARSLRLLVSERSSGSVNAMSAPHWDLERNGLGYNNLLYIGTVLAELTATSSASLPLLLVEEPEAHLHPQLQTLLADCLGRGLPGQQSNRVQTLVTTHSPTIAAHVAPHTVSVMHRDRNGGLKAVRLSECGLDSDEMRKLRRMLDVTRASMLFARGVILVEGVSEALLLPVLARRLGMDLDANGVTVVPVCGVDFTTFGKLFGEGRLQIPLAVVTDADPGVERINAVQAADQPWQAERPCELQSGEGYPESDRLKVLKDKFSNNSIASVFHSSVTLEYDLALASERNARCMVDAWLKWYAQPRRSPLQHSALDAAVTPKERARLLWWYLCRSDGGPGKGEFAQELAALLDDRDESGQYIVPINEFTVLDYLRCAIEHARGGRGAP